MRYVGSVRKTQETSQNMHKHTCLFTLMDPTKWESAKGKKKVGSRRLRPLFRFPSLFFSRPLCHLLSYFVLYTLGWLSKVEEGVVSTR